jgi:hypothetical protein
MRRSGFGLRIPILLTFTTLFAFRILMGMSADGYPIYYNGPVVLCFLVLARLMIPRAGRKPRFIFAGEALMCVSCLPVRVPDPRYKSHRRTSITLIS